MSQIEVTNSAEATEKTSKAAPKAKAEKAPTKAKVAKPAAAASEENDTGVRYNFADNVSESVPTAPLDQIVMADFDSRMAPAEPTEEFLEDVRINGIHTPIVVAPLADGKYLLVAGRRRYKAAHKLGLKTVPINPRVLTDAPGDDGMPAKARGELLCLSENLQRADLNGYDLAVQMRHFRDVWGWSQVKIAKAIGRKEAFVSQYLGIFELHKGVQAILRKNAQDGGIIAKARLLKAIKNPEDQLKVAEDCFNKESPWTVQNLADVVEAIKEKEAKAAERAAAREQNKDKKPRRAAASEGSDEAEEEEAAEDPFEKAAVALKLGEMRSYGSLIVARFQRVRAQYAEANEKDRAALEVKLAYERGAADTIKVIFGEKKAPKSVASSGE